ncbi:MAG TPA: hypothetical protein VHG08_07875 [Longimicrobium sp.]|nr:hypothetical protein [Longimicrobium sp.]
MESPSINMRAVALATALNLVIAAAPAKAGWDDDVCGPKPHACCPECSIGCECNSE